MVNIAVLVSGGGTNLQALIDAEQAGRIKNGKLALVLSSSEGAYALKRAETAGIETAVVDKKQFVKRSEFTQAIIDMLRAAGTGLVVMAGFNFILTPEFSRVFENRIINVHPALIPAFSGKGYYGLHVHEAVLEYGVKLTGATVHFVNEITDGGAIILQKAVAVREGDTPEILQRRVMEKAEWVILPQAASLFCEGRLTVEGRTVHIAGELDM